MNSKKLIALTMSFSMIAMTQFTGCSDNGEESAVETLASESSVAETEPIEEPTTVETAETTEAITEIETETESEIATEASQDEKGVKFVGDEKVGYVDLSDSGYWCNFQEAIGIDALSVCQVSRMDMSSIITMTAYDSDVAPEDAAQNIAASMEAQGAEGITGATVELGVDKISSKQVYGFYPDEGMFLVSWIFNVPEDNYLHYISAEFPADDYIVSLMDTFSMKAPE